MSQENVEVVRRAYAAMKAGALDEFISCFDPEIEFSSRVLELEGTFRGHEGLREWVTGLLAAFPAWNPSIVELRDLGDRVLIHASVRGEGASSGVGIQDDFWQAVEFRGGRVVWYAAFRTEREAIEAVGLPE